MENLFEQAVNISKAHAYDVVSEQLQELKEENERLKKIIISSSKRTEKEEELLEELTESWVWELSVCHQAGGKINDFESVMRQAMHAAFYRIQADSKD